MAHQVVLSWSTAPAAGTYNVYRTSMNSSLPAVSAGQPAPYPAPWVKITSGLAAITFTDTTVTPGQWAYMVTITTVAQGESCASNIVSCEIGAAAIPPPQLLITSYQ